MSKLAVCKPVRDDKAAIKRANQVVFPTTGFSPWDGRDRESHLRVETGKQRLIEDTVRLKKAWLFATVWLGLATSLDEDYLTIPDYGSWPRKRLQEEVGLLRDDFYSLFAQIVEDPHPSDLQRAPRWMSEHFDRWQEDGGGIMTICTAQEFEREFGLLKVRSKIEVPPYAELLIQGMHCVAVRHPEYMLGRDLELLYSLFLDCELLLSDAELKLVLDRRATPKWFGAAGENSQALARAVIQTCFNLLETFVSGLAREHLMEHAEIPLETQTKMLNQAKSLRQRITLIPELITGRRSALQRDSALLDRLFGSIKQARDAFVHCEPGQQPSIRTGRVKEDLFHDVSKELVDETVTLTCELIHQTWNFVYRRNGPRWLPSLNLNTRKLDLKLAPRF